MSARKRRRAATDPLERANNKSDQDFIASYLQPGSPGTTPWTTQWLHPQTGESYRLSLTGSSRLSDPDLEACLSLVEETSRSDYENSTGGWRPAVKKREMRSEDLRYILVRDADGAIRGFTSLMPTYEEGAPVVYCYEIHLEPDLQGTGLGSLLLGFHYTVAHNLPPIAKVMLTCFVSNTRAMGFYRKLGFEIDGISPTARVLRGKTHLPDYAILSKPLAREDGDGPR